MSAVISIQAAVIFGRASRTPERDARSFVDDAVTEKPASLPEIPSSMIENIVDRLDERASIPVIRDAGSRITDVRSSEPADGIDEPAERIDDTAARIEILDDRIEIIDAMIENIVDRIDVIDQPTDQPAKGGEVADEVIDGTEGRMNRKANRIEVRMQSIVNQGEVS
jgi:hypothetical protein